MNEMVADKHWDPLMDCD